MEICILPLTSNSYAKPEPCGSFICASGSPGDSCSTTSVVSLGGDALILMYSGWLQVSDGGFLEIPWCAGNDLSYKSKAWVCRSIVYATSIFEAENLLILACTIQIWMTPVGRWSKAAHRYSGARTRRQSRGVRESTFLRSRVSRALNEEFKKRGFPPTRSLPGIYLSRSDRNAPYV
jgi:hypothetical protein